MYLLALLALLQLLPGGRCQLALEKRTIDHEIETLISELDHDLRFLSIQEWTWNDSAPAAVGVDPRGSIRCIGDFPDDMIALEPSRPPMILKSTLEFCAEPEYGGRLGELWGTDNLAGVACAYFLNPPRVVVSRKWQTPRYHNDWKRWHYCQTKCFCLEPPITPESAEAVAQSNQNLPLLARPARPGAQREYEKHTYALQLFEGADTNINEVPVEAAHPIPIYQSRQGLARDENPNANFARAITISGIRHNQITCRATLPPWPLPLNRNYRNTHELCAADFLGGKPNASAGSVCATTTTALIASIDRFAHPILSVSDDYLSSVAEFARESSARIAHAMAVKLWCTVNCVCSQRRPNARLRNMYSTRTAYGDVVMGAGSVILNSNKGPEWSWTLIQNGKPMETSMEGTSGEKTSCEPLAANTAWCANPPPAKAIQFIAKISRETTALHIPSSSETSGQACGASCSGPADCPSKNGAQGCSCVADSKSVVSSQTYDPVLGNVLKYTYRATCLALGANLLLNGGVTNGAGAGRGRKLKREQSTGAGLGPAKGQSPCVCNATYVSTGCCGSLDGLIWEDVDSGVIWRGI